MASEIPPKKKAQRLEVPTTIRIESRLASALNVPEDVTPDQVRGSLRYVLNLLDLDNKANLSDEDKEREEYLMELGFGTGNAGEMLNSYANQIKMHLEDLVEATVKCEKIVAIEEAGTAAIAKTVAALVERNKRRSEAFAKRMKAARQANGGNID